MRRLMAKITVAVLMLGASTMAQTQSSTVEYHSASDLKQQFAKLADQAKTKNSGSTGADLAKYSNHELKLSYRRGSGGAEVHVHLADIFFVTGGSATLITGGKIVDERKENENEIKGKSIEGGSRQELSPGDVVHIPANTPHQLILDPGKELSVVVVKVHD
jgi:mannose-6-phosphate isomerase-like protein (cupin superfamily)